ncbi:MAG: DUF4197 domain-containing protein [Bacteroidota bacterium]
MKRITAIILMVAITGLTEAQTLKGLIKKNTSKDSATGKSKLDQLLGAGGSVGSLSNSDIVNGLKEALEKGAQKSTDKLSLADGFFANAALKILMPPEAKNVEQKLRGMGLDKQVDNAILAMNRAAEDAAKSAAPIFINAIKSMSISDAMSILKGSDTAATSYLQSKTVSPLTEAFRPVIESSLEKVDATKYWKTLFTSYNMVSLKKVNPDLTAYVTERALSGIFLQLGNEEAEIRKNPAARTTALLQKVFGN